MEGVVKGDVDGIVEGDMVEGDMVEGDMEEGDMEEGIGGGVTYHTISDSSVIRWKITFKSQFVRHEHPELIIRSSHLQFTHAHQGQ